MAAMSGDMWESAPICHRNKQYGNTDSTDDFKSFQLYKKRRADIFVMALKQGNLF